MFYTSCLYLSFSWYIPQHPVLIPLFLCDLSCFVVFSCSQGYGNSVIMLTVPSPLVIPHPWGSFGVGVMTVYITKKSSFASPGRFPARAAVSNTPPQSRIALSPCLGVPGLSAKPCPLLASGMLGACILAARPHFQCSTSRPWVNLLIGTHGGGLPPTHPTMW